MAIFELLLTFPSSYTLFYYFSFSFQPYEASQFTTILVSNIRGFVNLLLLVFVTTDDDLRVISKNLSNELTF